MYADQIIDIIDPDKKFIQRRFYRDSCYEVEGYFVKDLDIMQGRDKKDIIIVDNSILAFAFHLENGVPIAPFLGDDKEDKELLFLIAFLEEAFYEDNSKKILEKTFKLNILQQTSLEWLWLTCVN